MIRSAAAIVLTALMILGVGLALGRWWPPTPAQAGSADWPKIPSRAYMTTGSGVIIEVVKVPGVGTCIMSDTGAIGCVKP